SYSVTSTAAHLPSGATDGAPMRLNFHRSSGVMPRFSAAVSGVQSNSAQQKESHRMISLAGSSVDVILWKDWARRDSNPHAFRHRILSPARLPVTPLARRVDSIIRRSTLPSGSALTAAAGNSYEIPEHRLLAPRPGRIVRGRDGVVEVSGDSRH